VSTEVYRIFHTDGNDIDRFKHSLRPRMVYTYIPEEDQSQYPYFDAIDRIEEKNKLTYSLTNLFTTRARIAGVKSASAQTSRPDYHYQDVLRIYLEQSYDFNEAAENESSEWRNGETQEPFSEIYGLIEVTPQKYVNLKADAEWSPYDSDWVSHNASTTLTDPRGDQLSIAYRYKKDIPNIAQEGLESIYTKLSVNVTAALTASTEYEKDLYEDNEVLASVGALYKAQCWSFRLTFTREDDEERYDFMIGLHGLGEIESEL